MTTGKPKRPGTRGDPTSSGKTPRPRLKPPAPPARRAELPPPSRPSGAAIAEPRPRPLSTPPPLPPRTIPPPAPGSPAAVAAAQHEITDDAVVETTELPDVPQLRVAVFEDEAYLETAQDAVIAAGHIVAGGGYGDSGRARIVELVHRGGIDAVVVGLPGGEAVIDAALALEPRRPVAIAALSSEMSAAIRQAIAAGADLVTRRPHGVGSLAPMLLAAGRLHVERRAALSARGSEAVLRARLEQIAHGDPRGLASFELFQRELEREIKRAKRYGYALSVALFAVEIQPPPPPAGIRGILRARAGNAIVHSIRDIDLATELDHERYLVLLPYTDLSGAAEVAQRILATVAAGEPVVAAGRSFPPKVVGAVAGARADQPLSFARLMKDATRALDQARRDGADLAVQP